MQQYPMMQMQEVAPEMYWYGKPQPDQSTIVKIIAEKQTQPMQHKLQKQKQSVKDLENAVSAGRKKDAERESHSHPASFYVIVEKKREKMKL